MSNSKASVFICGGGTGGHFFSGLALAEKILDYFPEHRILFIGTRNGIEARQRFTDSRMDISFIRAKGLMGKGALQKFQGIFYLLAGIWTSIFLLVRHRPRLVVGVGGYASAPTLFAAYALKILLGHRLLVLEQNSSPGLVNRLLSFLPGVRAVSGFPAPHFQVLPLPVRRKVEVAARQSRPFQWPPKIIFVLGGSQGAHGLNQKWKDLLPLIKKSHPKLKFVHQTGVSDEESLKLLYKSFQIEALVFSFSNDMARLYEEADCVISRAGAMTIFELMTFKRPTLFVPFPKATDNHQWKNATAVQEEKWIVKESDFNFEKLNAFLTASTAPLPQFAKEAKGEWRGVLSSLLA